MRVPVIPRALVAAAVALGVSTPGVAQGWSNYGGNARRNGLSDACGPTGADLLWEDARTPSIVAWQPFVADGPRGGASVVVVRQYAFPALLGPPGDEILAYDLESGTVRWRTTLPYGGDPTRQWTAWVGAVDRGRVIASRASSSAAGPLVALDLASGARLWTSATEVLAGPHDGIVTAPDGDLLVGDAASVSRIRASDGATIWRVSRACVISGSCGVALGADGVYLDEPVAGGNRLVCLDPASGARLREGPVMGGPTEQNTPFVSAEGDVVFFAMSSGLPLLDRLYAFLDDGSTITELWSRPIRWTVHQEQGVLPTGGVLAFLPGDELVVLDPASGSVVSSAGVLAPLAGLAGASPRAAVDREGRVYVSNGWSTTPGSSGRLWAFEPGLGAPLFTLPLDKPNAGGPALGPRGTLVLADRYAVRAWRSPVAGKQTVRPGQPPNPFAFVPTTSAPALGEVWTPRVDHTSFLPGASLDFALVSDAAPMNLPLAIGTVVCPPPPVGTLFTALPGKRFAIPVPSDCALLGRVVVTQGGSIEEGVSQLANGIDLAVGNH